MNRGSRQPALTMPVENGAALAPMAGSFKEYLAIARLDHMTKHVFILPGIVLAYALRNPPLDGAVQAILLGFLSAVAIAGANYVINEWLDRSFDAFHPRKSNRTAVQHKLSPAIVYAEYVLLLLIGLGTAKLVNEPFFYTSVAFAVSGLLYNVKPIRTKDRAYVDVASESINNPIRLTLGWLMIDPGTMPPGSLLLAYWTGGAFLMAAKRLSEYRDISRASGVEILHRYRRSFLHYTAETLTISCLVYAMMAAFFLAIFLTKYRLEYVLTFPFIATLFASYFWLSMLKDSIAQRPERMFRSRRLVAAVAATVAVLLLTSLVDLPILARMSEPGFATQSAGR